MYGITRDYSVEKVLAKKKNNWYISKCSCATRKMIVIKPTYSTALIHCFTPMVGTAWTVIGLCFEMNAQAVWHSRDMPCADAEDHCARCEALHIAKGTWIKT